MSSFFEATEGYFPENAPWSNEISKLLDEAANGGGDFGEIHRTINTIKSGDEESWFSAWFGLAETVERLGIIADRRGERVTAIQSYFRASNYFRVASSFLLREDIRESRAFERHVQLFQKAGALCNPKIEPIEIPFEESTLHAYVSRPIASKIGNESFSDEKMPLAIIVGDVNSSCEENFFSLGAEAIKRDMAILLLDPPGQGSTLRIQKLAARFDFERVAAAVIDHLSSEMSQFIDCSRVGMVGSGMGSYYAVRAGAKEQRIKAIVVFGAVYNAVADLFDFYPPIRRWMIRSLEVAESTQARAKLGDFNLEGVAGEIACPILINHGTLDFVSSPFAANRLHDAIAHKNKVLKLYKAGHGISAHRAEAVSSSLDWLKRKLQKN